MKRALTLEDAKRQYPHRFTLEHMPQWARAKCEGNGKYYTPQYATDKEWYENTIFPGEQWMPKRGGYCYSTNPSWPIGQWKDHL